MSQCRGGAPPGAVHRGAGGPRSTPSKGVELPAVPERTEIRLLTLDELAAPVRTRGPGPTGRSSGRRS
jgi:hypothetical protein